jgi:hypothetical protein
MLPIACEPTGFVRCLSLLAFATAVLASAAATAQEPRVRASLSGDEQVWVGQRVTVAVELLAPGYFSSAAQFDIPDPAGVLLMPPQGHPVVGNETIDGLLYTVQRHELLAWPMRAGDASIPAVSVRFTFKRNPLDKDDEQASLTTGPIPFTVTLPPGGVGLGTVISARDLDVRDAWNPEPGREAVEAGQAFRRTITFTAPDVPGMVFPPFPASDIDGLGIYAKHHLDDTENRGALRGMRRDEITYVFERPGEFTIPAVQLTWFDLDAKQLRTEELPGQSFTVVANPAMATANAGPAPASSNAWSWGRLATGLALIVLVYFALHTERHRRRISKIVERYVAPFRPVHLQSLNPIAFNKRTGQ